MDSVITAIAGVVAFVAAAFLARMVGRALRSVGSWAQILVGLLIVAAATSVSYWGLLTGVDMWWGAGIGLGFGGLSGLRYGRGTLFDLLGRRESQTDGGVRR